MALKNNYPSPYVAPDNYPAPYGDEYETKELPKKTIKGDTEPKVKEDAYKLSQTEEEAMRKSPLSHALGTGLSGLGADIKNIAATGVHIAGKIVGSDSLKDYASGMAEDASKTQQRVERESEIQDANTKGLLPTLLGMALRHPVSAASLAYFPATMAMGARRAALAAGEIGWKAAIKNLGSTASAMGIGAAGSIAGVSASEAFLPVKYEADGTLVAEKGNYLNKAYSDLAGQLGGLATGLGFVRGKKMKGPSGELLDKTIPENNPAEVLHSLLGGITDSNGKVVNIPLEKSPDGVKNMLQLVTDAVRDNPSDSNKKQLAALADVPFIKKNSGLRNSILDAFGIKDKLGVVNPETPDKEVPQALVRDLAGEDVHVILSKYLPKILEKKEARTPREQELLDYWKNAPSDFKDAVNNPNYPTTVAETMLLNEIEDTSRLFSKSPDALGIDPEMMMKFMVEKDATMPVNNDTGKVMLEKIPINNNNYNSKISSILGEVSEAYNSKTGGISGADRLGRGELTANTAAKHIAGDTLNITKQKINDLYKVSEDRVVNLGSQSSPQPVTVGKIEAGYNENNISREHIWNRTDDTLEKVTPINNSLSEMLNNNSLVNNMNTVDTTIQTNSFDGYSWINKAARMLEGYLSQFGTEHGMGRTKSDAGGPFTLNTGTSKARITDKSEVFISPFYAIRQALQNLDKASLAAKREGVSVPDIGLFVNKLRELEGEAIFGFGGEKHYEVYNKANALYSSVKTHENGMKSHYQIKQDMLGGSDTRYLEVKELSNILRGVVGSNYDNANAFLKSYGERTPELFKAIKEFSTYLDNPDLSSIGIEGRKILGYHQERGYRTRASFQKEVGANSGRDLTSHEGNGVIPRTSNEFNQYIDKVQEQSQIGLQAELRRLITNKTPEAQDSVVNAVKKWAGSEPETLLLRETKQVGVQDVFFKPSSAHKEHIEPLTNSEILTNLSKIDLSTKEFKGAQELLMKYPALKAELNEHAYSHFFNEATGGIKRVDGSNIKRITENLAKADQKIKQLFGEDSPTDPKVRALIEAGKRDENGLLDPINVANLNSSLAWENFTRRLENYHEMVNNLSKVEAKQLKDDGLKFFTPAKLRETLSKSITTSMENLSKVQDEVKEVKADIPVKDEWKKAQSSIMENIEKQTQEDYNAYLESLNELGAIINQKPEMGTNIAFITKLWDSIKASNPLKRVAKVFTPTDMHSEQILMNNIAKGKTEKEIYTNVAKELQERYKYDEYLNMLSETIKKENFYRTNKMQNMNQYVLRTYYNNAMRHKVAKHGEQEND